MRELLVMALGGFVGYAVAITQNNLAVLRDRRVLDTIQVLFKGRGVAPLDIKNELGGSLGRTYDSLDRLQAAGLIRSEYEPGGPERGYCHRRLIFPAVIQSGEPKEGEEEAV